MRVRGVLKGVGAQRWSAARAASASSAAARSTGRACTTAAATSGVRGPGPQGRPARARVAMVRPEGQRRVDRHGHSPLGVAHGHGDAAQMGVQLRGHHGVALLPHARQLGHQRVHVREGVLRGGGARGACEQGTGLVLGQVGQQHAAHGRGERGQARADVEVHPQDPLGVHTRDVHQVRPVEHARGAGLVQALRGLGEDRPEDLGDGPAGPVAVAELQHARGQREPPPVLHGVAELRERQQHAPRRGPGDPRGGRGLAHRERGGVRGERAQHRQTGRQGAHHVPARRGTCAGGVDVVGHVRQRSPLCAQRTPVRVTHTPFPARRGGPTVRP